MSETLLKWWRKERLHLLLTVVGIALMVHLGLRVRASQQRFLDTHCGGWRP